MQITLVPVSSRRQSVDLFVVGSFQKERPSKEFNSLEPTFTHILKSAVSKGRFEGKSGQDFSSFHDDHREAPEVLLLGLGEKKKYRAESLRKVIGQTIQLAKRRKFKKVRFLLDSFTGSSVSLQDAVKAIAEVSILAAYDFDKYKSKKGQEDGRQNTPQAVEILYLKKQAESSLKKGMEWACVVAEGTLCARNLINEPGNIMNPQRLAHAARELAAKKKISFKMLGPSELKQLKMGGILAVNQGSKTPPALIILEYGPKYKKNGTVCLVGKGVTFDTGGISIKPARDMEKMKYDMSGAATVIGTMGVIADLKLPLHVVALAPAVENMVAENPQRPGDIIKMFNGKSVEVLNTDAEGRLILADALAYSEKFKPKAIIDLATLTGMCVYTFGDKAIGLMGTDERLLNRIKKAGEETGERCWELPLWDEYRSQIKGHHSDLVNIGGSYGGTITAGMFLKEFVPPKIPWAHLDIAGTAWCDSPRYDCPKGATGVGVRLLAELISNW